MSDTFTLEIPAMTDAAPSSAPEIETRICKDCSQDLPLTNHYFKKQGVYYMHTCHECRYKEAKAKGENPQPAKNGVDQVEYRKSQAKAAKPAKPPKPEVPKTGPNAPWIRPFAQKLASEASAPAASSSAPAPTPAQAPKVRTKSGVEVIVLPDYLGMIPENIGPPQKHKPIYPVPKQPLATSDPGEDDEEEEEGEEAPQELPDPEDLRADLIIQISYFPRLARSIGVSFDNVHDLAPDDVFRKWQLMHNLKGVVGNIGLAHEGLGVISETVEEVIMHSQLAERVDVTGFATNVRESEGLDEATNELVGHYAETFKYISPEYKVGILWFATLLKTTIVNRRKRPKPGHKNGKVGDGPIVEEPEEVPIF